MRKEHLLHLRCPKSKGVLQLENEIIVEGRIKYGYLVVPQTDHKYPIVDFIPRFVPTDNYANNFGIEWNNHSKTQYDSKAEISISETRFVEETKWGHNLEGQIILEGGSGSGRFTEAALNTGATIVSFDYSNAVEANYQSNGASDNLLLVQASIFEMPFEDDYFDKVFCIGVLQHTPDPEEAFKCLVSVLRLNGHIVTDIYRKSIANYYLTPKFLIRRFTTKMDPERLYAITVKYINFVWPLARLIMKIPKIGKSINWRLKLNLAIMVLREEEKGLNFNYQITTRLCVE